MLHWQPVFSTPGLQSYSYDQSHHLALWKSNGEKIMFRKPVNREDFDALMASKTFDIFSFRVELLVLDYGSSPVEP